MLDPVSAVGLASSVIQIVDFSCKLVSKTREYRASADGALIEHKELRAAADRLSALSKAVNGPLTKCKSLRKPTNVDTALSDIAGECLDRASELTQALEELQIDDSRNTWKSFRQALKAIWNKEKIEQIRRRLDTLREHVVIHLLVSISDRQEVELRRGLSRSEYIERTIVNEIQKSGTQLKLAITKLTSDLLKATNSTTEGILVEWSEKNQEVVSRDLNNLIGASQRARDARSTDAILTSLYFTQMNDRYSRIPEAHTKTLRWIFDAPISKCKFSNFKAWLRKDSRDVYWITGKPGSGKSTLMRFLWDAPDTKRHLRQWCGDLRLVCANCFFWNPGTQIQRSLTGLLRALLHQLLSQCPEMVPKALPHRWLALELQLSKTDAWLESEMLSAIRYFVREVNTVARVFFIVDSLDEFDGNDEQRLQVINLFKDIAQSPSAKVCLSSRPWLIFQDEFDECPSLKLEDLTRSDIRNYVRDCLGHNNMFRALQLRNKVECNSLMDEIGDRAQGVFLWVYLVVRMILSDLRDGNDLRELHVTLHSFPVDLEAFFRHMIGTLEPRYCAEAANLFQLVLNNTNSRYDSHPLSLMTTSFISEKNPDFAITADFQGLPEADMLLRLDQANRRLNSRCKGLLEVSETEASGPFYAQRVDFLHRTVRDFLMTRDMSDMLDGFQDLKFQPVLFLCHAFLAQIKMLNLQFEMSSEHSSPNDLARLVQQFIRSTQEWLNSTGDLDSRMIDELGHTLDHHLSLYGQRDPPVVEWWLYWRSRTSPTLTLAVRENLTPYITQALAKCDNITTASNERPLLDCALRRRLIALDYIAAPDPMIVRLLIALGGNPNQSFETVSIWAHYVKYLYDVSAVKPKSDPNTDLYYRKEKAYSDWFQTTKLLFQNGGPNFFQLPLDYHRCSAAKEKPGQRSILNVKDAFRAFFNAEDAQELQRLFESPRKKQDQHRNKLRSFPLRIFSGRKSAPV